MDYSDRLLIERKTSSAVVPVWHPQDTRGIDSEMDTPFSIVSINSENNLYTNYAQYISCESGVKKPQKWKEKSNIREIKPEIRIYDGNFVQIKHRRVVLKEQPKHLQGVTRGKIKGFSHKSSLRLRKALATMHQPSCDPYSLTLTTQKKFNPDEWRAIMKRFAQNFQYYAQSNFEETHEPAIIYRVELQKRGTPHIHCLLWHLNLYQHFDDETYWFNRIRDSFLELWLKATREERNEHLERYAIHLEWGLDTKWQEYMVAHTTKKKETQLGWKGRQWGILNRRALVEKNYLKVSEKSDCFLPDNDRWLKVYKRTLRMAMKGRQHTPRGIKKLKGVNDAHITTGDHYANTRLLRSIADIGILDAVESVPPVCPVDLGMIRKFDAQEAKATPS